MREPSPIEAISEREVSRLIRYLDPEIPDIRNRIRHKADVEGLIMLVTLLGGVIVCFVVLLIHVAE